MDHVIRRKRFFALAVCAIAVFSFLPTAVASSPESLPGKALLGHKDPVAEVIQTFGSIPLRKLPPAEAAAVLAKVGKIREPEVNTHGCGHTETLACGVTSSGNLASGDCVLSSDNTFYDVWTFQGAPGAVSIQMSSSQFDTYLALISPSNSVLDEDDDGGGGTNSRIDFTLGSSGTYTVIANSFAVATGSYTLVVNGAGCTGGGGTCTPQASTIACNQTGSGNLTSTDCTLSDGTRYDVFTFSGTSGQQVTIQMSSTAFDTYLLLANPNGNVVAEDDDGGGGTNSRIQFTLTSTGTWFILANAFSTSGAGAYTVQLTCGGQPPPPGGCGETTMCLQNNRFRVSVTWRAFDGSTGVGRVLPFSNDTGMFWFFSASNVELVVKILDGRPVNGRWWVFYGALSNVQYTVTVTDTQTGATKTYNNPSGNLASVADTNAFP